MLRTWRFLHGGHQTLARRRVAARARRKEPWRGRLLGVESLEDRWMLAASPVLSLEIGDAPQFFAVGGSFTPFRATFTDVDDGTNVAFNYSINWGDGSDIETGNTTRFRSQAGPLEPGGSGAAIFGVFEVFHPYVSEGQYTVTVTLSDGSLADSVTEQTTVNVYPRDNGLRFDGNFDPVNEGTPFTFSLRDTVNDPFAPEPIIENISSWTINWGDSIQVINGNPSSVTHTYGDDDNLDSVFPGARRITVAATGSNGTYFAWSGGFKQVVDVPTMASIWGASDVNEGEIYTLNLSAFDPGDSIDGWIVFFGDEATLEDITVVSGNPPTATHVYANGDASYTIFAFPFSGNEQLAVAIGPTVTVHNVLNASISGVVYVDVNQNGLFDANEPGVNGVVIKLLDQTGNPVLDEFGDPITAVTNSGGYYLFEDLPPGVYQVSEMQPTGVTDGAEHLGSLGGAVVANDRMQLTLAGVDAFDYVFAEFGQQLTTGDTAGTGFWQNKHGQQLIAQGGTQLAAWLTTTFPNIFGNALVGASGSDVAAFYRDQLFKQQSKKSGPPKVDAQFMAVALATYFTSNTLAGQVAASYGVHVTDTGIGTKVVNVGTKGAAFGVADGSNRTIMQLLLATNNLTDQPNVSAGFAMIYDIDGNGVINSTEANLRTMAFDMFSSINAAGGI